MSGVLGSIAFLWNYVLPFLLVLTALVFVHEIGHYLVARWNHVRVEVFSVGFGHEIFGWTDRRGTRWKMSWVPLGGYVRFFGDANAANGAATEQLAHMAPSERAVSFHHKSLPRRAAIILAGPLANFVLAIALYGGLFATIGQPFTPPVVGSVVPDGVAEAVGLRAGDRVIELDGSSIERFQEMQRIASMSPERPLSVKVERDGAVLDLVVVPALVVERDRFGNTYRIGRIGVIGGAVEHVRHDPFTSLWRGAGETVMVAGATLVYVGEMIMGRRTTEDLGGPVRIAQISGQMWQLGLTALVSFAAVLSINLGLINLFPVPMLDGGRLLYYGIEALRGRPLAARVQEYGLGIGAALVLCLFLFVTWNDLVNLKVVEFFSRIRS
ncbi:MAG: RIP metalloprotease RseP [Alphaproteobacteria bacterium]|nr:RIP metalloprotease RseP [Alphaproteobacteria bacterium]